MGKVVLDISMSLDGFIRAANPRPEEPLGEGGLRLHAWITDSDARKLLEEAVAGLGATITGRTNYDDAIRWWGEDGPSGSERKPLFVVTHEVPAESPEGGVYTFATGGIEEALEQDQIILVGIYQRRLELASNRNMLSIIYSAESQP